MPMIRQNRLIPILGSVILVAVVAILFKSRSPTPEHVPMASVPQPPARTADADSPADTIRTLTAEVQEARAAGAEAIIGYTVGPELAVLTQARAEAGFKGPMYGPWPLSFRTVWDKAGAAAEGVMMVQTIIQDLSNERRMSFIARLKRHAGAQPIGSLMAAAQTYDAVHLMLRVLFQTNGDTSGDALKRALEDLRKPYVGVVTTHDKPFSPSDHDAFSRNMIWLGVWRRGEVQFYYPEDAKRVGFVRRKEL